jgi:hypothetical protein
MKDGEKREVRASRMHSMWKNDRFKVEAERYDCDTPFVHLTLRDRRGTLAPDPERSICMTDTEAHDLVDRLQRALGMLPSSK